MEGLDTVLCPVNPARDSRHYLPAKDPANPNGHFREVLLPAAREKGIGIIAMKTTAQGRAHRRGAGKTDAATLIRFALSEPGVCVAIVGPGHLRHLKQNIETTRRFTPLSDEERHNLIAHVAGAGPHLAYEQLDYGGS